MRKHTAGSGKRTSRRGRNAGCRGTGRRNGSSSDCGGSHDARHAQCRRTIQKRGDGYAPDSCAGRQQSIWALTPVQKTVRKQPPTVFICRWRLVNNSKSSKKIMVESRFFFLQARDNHAIVHFSVLFFQSAGL